MLECVVNVSEGRDRRVIERLAAAAGPSLLDVHSDPWHHRSVLTLAGPLVEDAARAVAREAVAAIDVRYHDGAHPRLGALDVVPFVPLAGSFFSDALAARNRFGAWAGRELALPCFYYGPERSLPELRREAFRSLSPDTGPPTPHPTAGGCAVGVRHVLVAYNLFLRAGTSLELARRIAAEIRGPALRALAFDLGGKLQVSCNLLEPHLLGPAEVYDAVARRAPVERAELVGLVPRDVLEATDPRRWDELDLSPDRTIEARVEALLGAQKGPAAEAAGADRPGRPS